MNETTLKTDLHDKIAHADIDQLKGIYGLITNYLNGYEEPEEWDSMPELHKNLINKGLEQADAGLGTPLKTVNQKMRQKYGLND